MRLLDLGHVSGLLEPLERLEQIGRQILSVEVDAETLDKAAALEYYAAGFPEAATLVRTRFANSVSGAAKGAGLVFDLAHIPSVDCRAAGAIGSCADAFAVLYGNERRRPLGRLLGMSGVAAQLTVATVREVGAFASADPGRLRSAPPRVRTLKPMPLRSSAIPTTIPKFASCSAM